MATDKKEVLGSYRGKRKRGSVKRGTASVMQPKIKSMPPRWYSPLLSFINYYLPFDRATLYQYLRYFDTFHPLFGNAIDLHTQMPLSRFGLKNIKDPKIQQFYEDMLDNMDAFVLMYDQLREYWLIGEVLTYLNWNDELGVFTDGEILVPEYIEIKGHPIVGKGQDSYLYYYIPDEDLISFVNDSSPEVEELKQNLSPELLDAIVSNKKILLNNFNLMVMMNKQSRYAKRGTSIGLRTLIDLIYESKLREAQIAIAERFITPKELWFVGNDEFFPTQKYLDDFLDMILQIEQQETFTLVTHHAVRYEIIGATGKFPNLSSEFDWIENRILTALFTNKAMTHGEGPNYATASVAARVLLMRYMEVRAKLEEAWKRNVFLPVAIANDMYEITEAELSHNIRRPYSERKPVIPDFDWRHKTNLLDDNSYRELITRMRREIGLPMKVISDVLGIDYDYIKQWIKKEEGTVFDPLYQEWRKTLLNEITKVEKRSGLELKKDIDKIPEPPDVTKEVGDLSEKEFSFLMHGGLKRKARLSARYLKHKKEEEIEKE